MPILHAIHLQLLHAALGLSYYVRRPTRDTLPQADERAHLEEVAALVALGYLAPEQYHGEGGASTSMRITEAGRAIALAHPPAHYNDTAAQTAAPQQPQPRSKSMTTEAPARKTRKSAEKTQAPDTRTGDLLAGAEEKGSAPPFELTPAAPDQSGQPGPLALATLKPTEYVAQVYQPFHEKFERYAGEANGVVFAHDAEAMAWLEKQPDDKRELYKVVDISTTEGMKLAVMHRARFRDEVRLAATHEHKDRKAPILEIGRLLDAKKNEIIAAVEPYETRFDKAIKDEEERKARAKAEADRIEAERVAAIRAKIDAITALATVHANDSSEALKAVLVELAQRRATAEEFENFTGEAALAIEATGSALHVLYNGALAREQAEAERIRLAEEERARIAAQEEANKREQERLAAERARIEQQQKEAAEAAAALKLAQEQQQRTMEEVSALQRSAEIADTDARGISAMLDTLRAWPIDAEYLGAAGAGMVKMARDMAVRALEQRYAAAVAEELPAAHAEALEMDALLDKQDTLALQAEMVPPAGGYLGFAHSDGSIEVYMGEPAPAPAPEPAPEPARLPEPEAYSRIDEQINIGSLTDAADEGIAAGVADGPNDEEILGLIQSEYGWSRLLTIRRLQVLLANHETQAAA